MAQSGRRRLTKLQAARRYRRYILQDMTMPLSRPKPWRPLREGQRGAIIPDDHFFDEMWEEWRMNNKQRRSLLSKFESKVLAARARSIGSLLGIWVWDEATQRWKYLG